MEQLPVFMNLRGQSCLVAGEENKAYHKILLLLKAEARVYLLTQSPCRRIRELFHQNRLVSVDEPLEKLELSRFRLVICASENSALNELLARRAMELNIPVNVVDQPDLCTFTIPSIVDRSPLIVAVSSSGKSPTLSKFVRRKIEALLPHTYGPLTEMLGNFRKQTRNRTSDYSEKKRFWERLLSGPLVDLFLSGKEQTARDVMQHELEQASKPEKRGQVVLAGAGPGDPELLTLRALRHIQNADVIVYDRLVSSPVLDYANPDAEMVYAGKKTGDHYLSQQDINRKLIRLAQEGKSVVRLKGGDPFIFGRGGEELEELMDAGIDFQVIPGITAAGGCCAYAGIPLTHRDFAQSVVFVTAHGRDEELELNWESLTQPNQTLVFYMGLANAELVSRGLITHGLPADTPAALVQNGTTFNQKVAVGNIETLPRLIQEQGFQRPTLIIVGHTVTLHEKLQWYN